jgi:hypothetical protein
MFFFDQYLIKEIEDVYDGYHTLKGAAHIHKWARLLRTQTAPIER